MKTKIFADFEICISVHLTIEKLIFNEIFFPIFIEIAKLNTREIFRNDQIVKLNNRKMFFFSIAELSTCEV